MADRKSLTFAKRVEIMEFMRDKIDSMETANGKFAKYHDKWTDDLVAQYCGVNASNIKSIRQEIFGELARGGKTSSNSAELEELTLKVTDLDGQIAVLQQAVLNLNAQVSFLTAQIKTLEGCIVGDSK